MTTTPILGLEKPTVDGDNNTWGQKINDNYDKIDAFADNAQLLGGFKNKLINALGLVNQRGYASGAATTAANQYTVDRWRVVVSGQNLSWTTSAGVRTFTAPAGGVEQVIEGSCILSGTYVLNWEGTATATVNGTARTKGEAFSLTGGANVTVRFIGGTWAKPQLEQGAVTDFEVRHIQQEIALCQRYYRVISAADVGSLLFGHPGRQSGNTWRHWIIPFDPPMRSTPTLTQDATFTGGTYNSGAASPSTLAFRCTVIDAAENSVWDGGQFNLSAEL